MIINKIMTSEKIAIYKQLINDDIIDCQYDTFDQNTNMFKTAQGAYMELYKNTEQDENIEAQLINTLLNINSKDLMYYTNAMDWLVQTNSNVVYLDNFIVYIVFDKKDLIINRN